MTRHDRKILDYTRKQAMKFIMRGEHHIAAEILIRQIHRIAGVPR